MKTFDNIVHIPREVHVKPNQYNVLQQTQEYDFIISLKKKQFIQPISGQTKSFHKSKINTNPL